MAFMSTMRCRRLRDSQLGDARVHDIGNYIVRGKLWEAFDCGRQPVLLIDEFKHLEHYYFHNFTNASRVHLSHHTAWLGAGRRRDAPGGLEQAS